MPRKTRGTYTSGELNKIIDSVLHPLARKDKRFYALDLGFHALVEQDPVLSAKKFLRYDLPKILEGYGKKNSRRRRKRQCYR